MAIGIPNIEVYSYSISAEIRRIIDNLVLEILIKGEHPKEEDIEAFSDWSYKIGEDIGEIIDNPKNTVIREKIEKGLYEEVAEDILELLKN